VSGEDALRNPRKDATIENVAITAPHVTTLAPGMESI
jgi:hypothetical protein